MKGDDGGEVSDLKLFTGLNYLSNSSLTKKMQVNYLLKYKSLKLSFSNFLQIPIKISTTLNFINGTIIF